LTTSSCQTSLQPSEIKKKVEDIEAFNDGILENNSKIVEDEAQIINEIAKGLKTTETFLPSKENLSKVFFIDEKNGWIVGNKVDSEDKVLGNFIYKSVDGGNSWKQIKTNFPKNSVMKDLFFINNSTGWILLQNNANSWEEEKFKSWIYKTSDSGKTWQLIHTSKIGLHYYKLRFVDEKNGWLLAEGSVMKESPVLTKPYRAYSRFVFKITDSGKSLTDVSSDVSEDLDDDLPTDIFIENQNTIIISTSSQFFKTEDNGKTWLQFNANFYDDFIGNKNIAGIDESINHVGKLAENRYRIADGFRNDTEGSRSYLAIQLNDESWVLRRFSGETFCLSDIHFFNESQILAIGQFCRNILTEGKEFRNKDSVALFSSNNGETFSIAYNNPKIEDINSLAKISENHIIAVGDKGLIINIELEKPTN
jgi:photosystem II stability/assembly factor-like uncharacterized protein